MVSLLSDPQQTFSQLPCYGTKSNIAQLVQLFVASHSLMKIPQLDTMSLIVTDLNTDMIIPRVCIVRKYGVHDTALRDECHHERSLQYFIL